MPAFGTTQGGEQKHDYLILKKVKGVNTQPSREAIGQDEYAWLENGMPIGNAFIKTVPQVGTSIATLAATTGAIHHCIIGTTAYGIYFNTGGGAVAVNVASGSVTTIFPGGSFTSGYPAVDQWKSERIVIIDPSNGYRSWDGTLAYFDGSLATISVTVTGSGYTSTPTVVITGGTVGTTASANATIAGGVVSEISIVGVGDGYTSVPAITFSGGGGSGTTASAFIMPTGINGQSIAVYAGRVWIGNNRTLTYTAPDTWYDFDLSHASGSTTITESALGTRIYALKALDNFLYMFGDSAVVSIGDVKVSGATTTFSQTFLSSTTGTTLPWTITAMERAIIFCNKYGVHALVGASLQKISKPLDGLFPDITFDDSISAGLVQIYNIQCYALNFLYTGSGNGASNNRHIQAVFFDGKWFITSQSDLTFISPLSQNGMLSLWGTTGRDVKQLFSNTTSTIATTMITGLYDLGNPIFDKGVIQAGVEWSASGLDEITLQIDTETVSQSQSATSDSGIIWYNNSDQVIEWENNALETITWITDGFVLSDANFDIIGKYLGATVTSNSPGIAVNGILMEYVHRAPWSR